MKSLTLLKHFNKATGFARKQVIWVSKNSDLCQISQQAVYAYAITFSDTRGETVVAVCAGDDDIVVYWRDNESSSVYRIPLKLNSVVLHALFRGETVSRDVFVQAIEPGCGHVKALSVFSDIVFDLRHQLDMLHAIEGVDLLGRVHRFKLVSVFLCFHAVCLLKHNVLARSRKLAFFGDMTDMMLLPHMDDMSRLDKILLK